MPPVLQYRFAHFPRGRSHEASLVAQALSAMASREASMGGMAGVRNTIYNIFIRRTSVYTTTCVIAGIVGTNMFFKGSDAVWKSLNKGVSRFSASHARCLHLFDVGIQCHCEARQRTLTHCANGLQYVHVRFAGNAKKSWEEVLPTLPPKEEDDD